MQTTKQVTFRQFTVESAKEAVKLYFRPVRQVATWLGDEREPVDVRALAQTLHEEQDRQQGLTDALVRKIRQNEDALEVRLRNLERQLNPPFDSLEDLALRVKRVRAWLAANAGSELEPDAENAIDTLGMQLATAQLLAEASHREFDMEQAMTDLRQKLRQMELSLGIETPPQPRKTARTRGATGD